MTIKPWTLLIGSALLVVFSASVKPTTLDKAAGGVCKHHPDSAVCLVDLSMSPNEPLPSPLDPVPHDVHIVDNSDAGFSASPDASFNEKTGKGFNGNYVGGHKKSTFYWQFENPAGQYDVHVYYPTYWNGSKTNFYVDGHAINVNQTKNNEKWLKIGTFSLTENTLISAKPNRNGAGHFDAVAITPVGVPVEPVMGYQGCLDYFNEGNDGVCELSPSVLTDVLYEKSEFPSAWGSGGPKKMLVAWCGGALDTDALTFNFMCGGHDDHYGNQWAQYDISNATFRRLTAPDLLNYVYQLPGGNYCKSPDLRTQMTSAHSYDGQEYHPERKTLIVINQGETSACTTEKPTGLIDLSEEYRGFKVWEYNHSDEYRVGLAPKTGRVLYNPKEPQEGAPTFFGAPRIEYNNGLVLGSRHSVYKATIVDDHLVFGNLFEGHPPGGQGVLSRFNDDYVTYINGSGEFKHLDSQGKVLHKITGGAPVGGGGAGVACCADSCLMYDGRTSFSEYTPYAQEWGVVEMANGPKIEPNKNHPERVYSKFRCLIPEENIYFFINGPTTPAYLFKHTASSPPIESPPMVTVEGSGPFTLGLGLKKGEFTQPVLNTTNQQTLCRKRWNDGSCKFAVASGYATGELSVVEGVNAGEQLEVVDTSDIFVKIGDALLTPGEAYRVAAGSQMIESHHRVTHNDVLILFYIRHYRGGERYVTVVAENGYLNLKTVRRDYAATVVIGSSTQTHDITHYRNTSWVASGWIGGHSVAYQDVDYLKASGLVPNYAISPEATPGSYQEYHPGENGNYTAKMGNTGYQAQIGLLPKWEAAYFANPTPLAYQSIMANSRAFRSYRIGWRDAETLEAIDLTKFPKWTVSGKNKGGVNQLCAGGICWERAHFPSAGYAAYLLTGEQVHLDTMALQATTCYLVQTWNYGGGLGVERLNLGQSRGQAWCWRAMGQYLALADDPSVEENLTFNMAHFATESVKNEIGVSFYRSSAYGAGVVAPWQQNFRVQTIGFLSDIEPLADMTNLIYLRDSNYRFIVGLLGENYCRAGKYTVRVGPSDSASIGDFYDDWSPINTGDPCTGELIKPRQANYWANLLPAISYAVDHDASGASEAWGILSGASNFQSWMNGFKRNAIFGVVPRQD